VASAAPASSQAQDSNDLYQQALALDKSGNTADAVRIYRRAARAGSGKAALRLAEIYEKGIGGVPRDYAESLQWYDTAHSLGEEVPRAAAR
jgi:serine/threonine-protein kinase